MEQWLSQIHHGDCIQGMRDLPAGSVDLAFADPPFNIGFEYDTYDDRVAPQEYLDWSRDWISAVYDCLKPNGTFWLAIGDEYAAELKLLSQEVGFHPRSWVIWYYTFGVNCKNKFTRSHAHLFYFVKDNKDFTFRGDELDNRVPSARELIYNDKRANPKGRLPDDTWIIRPTTMQGELFPDEDEGEATIDSPSDENRTFALRPQELSECFSAEEDTWYIPRVAGTFKERAGFHGCQMPEQLLGRIIRVCSQPGEVVLDPFSGSATTLAVAKKLGRQYLGFDLSENYVEHGRKRLKTIHVGDRLDGTAEPLKTQSPKATPKGRTKGKNASQHAAVEHRYNAIQLELTRYGVTRAFEATHDGYSIDRLVVDPELQKAFADACTTLGLVGDMRTWNSMLFQLRKAGKLAHVETTRCTKIDWEACDPYRFASEIAWQLMLDEGFAKSLDEILCDPALAAQFDTIAGRFAPGFSSLEYRWAALKLRKEAKVARGRGAVLTMPRLGEMRPLEALEEAHVPAGRGVYVVSEDDERRLYVGETCDLRRSLQVVQRHKQAWEELSQRLLVQLVPLDGTATGNLAWQSCLVRSFSSKPRLNCFELCLAG